MGENGEKRTASVQKRRPKPMTGYLFKRWRGKRVKKTSDIKGTFYLQLPHSMGLKQRTVCLHTDDLDEAEREQARICGPLKWTDRWAYLKAVAELGDWARSQLAIERTGDAVTVKDAWRRYEDSRRRPKSGPRTLKEYKSRWQAFVKWCPQKVKLLRDLTPDMADLYARHIDASKGRTASTVNTHLQLLRLVWRVLEPKTLNPWMGLSSNKEANRGTRRALDVEEVKALVNAATGEMRGLILLGYCTGLRLADCCGLRWDAIDDERNIMVITPRKTGRRKQPIRVAVPIHPQLRTYLDSVKRDGVYVFPRLRHAHDANNGRNLQRSLKALFDRANVKGTKDGAASFHSLRHTYDSLLKNAGAPVSLVMSLMGHKTAAVSHGYYHQDSDRARDVVGKLPRVV